MRFQKFTITQLKIQYVKLKTRLAIWEIRRKRLNVPEDGRECWEKVTRSFQLYQLETQKQLEEVCQRYCAAAQSGNQKE